MVNRILTGLVALVMAICAWSCAGADCRDNADCDADEICQAGGCATRCAGDDDCPVNRICSGGVCQLLPRCVSTDDCASGQVCSDRQCQPQEPECSGDVDCPPNFSCFEGGCYAPGTRPDGGCGSCENGETCVDGECVLMSVDADDSDADDASEDAEVGVDDPDVGEDSEPTEVTDAEPETADADPDEPDVTEPEDTAEPEETVDPDAPEFDALECGGRADCDPGEICVGGTCVPDPADAADVADAADAPDVPPDVSECVGAGRGELGELCTAAANCCNERCFGLSTGGGPGRGVCTDFCDDWDDCNPAGTPRELFCYRGGGLEFQFCTESQYLDPCVSVDNCNGGVPGIACVRQSTQPTGICSYRCLSSAECGEGSACGHVFFDLEGVFADVCVPIGEPCTLGTQCFSGICVTDDAGTSGFCTAYCNPLDPNACPAPSTCLQGLDPDLPTYGVCVVE